MARSICVMGIGNVLLGDDGLGPYVIAALQAGWEAPPGVTFFDAGTPGLDLTMFIDGLDALIAVDAVKAKGAPGELKVYRGAQVIGNNLPISMSPHEPSLREALMRSTATGTCPAEVLLIGAVPGRVSTGTGRSDEVRAAVPEIVAQVVRELERLGAPAAQRLPPLAPDVWWERRPQGGNEETAHVH